MTESTWKTLRTTLVESYDELSRRLTRALGSRDQADNALHDTWLRLAREGGSNLNDIRNPRAYLLRMALNAAATAKRSEPRWLSYDERIAFLDRLDDQPDQEAVALGKSELVFVRQVIMQMPARRRAIFEAAWLDQVSQKEIAARHSLSVRMVQIELDHATKHILERMNKANVVDFASARRIASDNEGEGSIDRSTFPAKE